MLRLVIFLIAIAVAATGLSWLADRPGSLIVNWQGYEIETSVFRAVVILAFLIGLAIMLWSLIMAVWRSPASIGMFFNRRRQTRGLEALSGGMIAIGAGDRDTATRFAVQARKALPNEPLTHLLRAQAAQLAGDRGTARRMFEAMLAQPDTEQLGLRGLFLEAEREGETEAARQFAQRSVDLNPKLTWAVDALFELQCKDKDWAGALKTLSIAKKHHHHDKAVLERRRAVLMTARAMGLEESDPNRAMGLAIEAHHLAHDFIPAAVLAGRMLASRGHTKRAAKIIERTWRRAAHPELALVYAYARIGDSPSDRLVRVKRLAQLNPRSIETPVAIATAALEAKDFTLARRSLENIQPQQMTQRVCTLMARLESEEKSDKGLAREWLARAVHAPRDPAWVADGVVADKWAPVSPRTGAFDAFQWRIPADSVDAADKELLAAKLDELVKLGAPIADAAEPAKVSAEAEPVRPGAGPSREAVDATVVPATESAGGSAKLSGGNVNTGKAGGAGVVTGSDLAARAAAAEATASKGATVVDVKPADGKAEAAGEPSKRPLEPSMFIAPKAADSGTSAEKSPGADKPARAAASG
jgi:HemY protein